MAKNVLIFSDGTGQGASMPQGAGSNVLKLYRATKGAAPAAQAAFYDPGLGAADDKDDGWWRWGYDLVSKATGLGISRNIQDCYEALIERYQPGDRIFLFGFSRGAYTARSLGGVLSLCGVPQRGTAGADPRIDKKAREALSSEAIKVYKTYGNDQATKAERKRLGEEFSAKYASDPGIPYFIGVWDTVRALGIPGSSGVVVWRHAFHDTSLNPKVAYGRHALSIDENREVFEPVLWEETGQDQASGRIKQVWFPGVHSDVGGGYREAGLSDLALAWMIDEALAIEHPLVVDKPAMMLKPSFKGMQHDERIGWGMAWIEGTREKFAPANLAEDHVGKRFNETTVPILKRTAPYRPVALRGNATYGALYGKR